MDSRVILRRLRDDGRKLRRTKGSQWHFTHRDRPGRVTVPHPRRDLPRGTLRSIYRQAGCNWKD